MAYLHVLTLILIVLKLCAVVTFSWWLVCLPSIIAVVIAIFAVGLILRYLS